MDLESARKEFDRLYWEDEDAFHTVIETAVAPDGIPDEDWEDLAYSFFDSTIDVLLDEDQPRDVLAIVTNGDDATVVRGLFTLAGEDEDAMARIGDVLISDASDLDAIAVGGDDIDTSMDFSSL